MLTFRGAKMLTNYTFTQAEEAALGAQWCNLEVGDVMLHGIPRLIAYYPHPGAWVAPQVSVYCENYGTARWYEVVAAGRVYRVSPALGVAFAGHLAQVIWRGEVVIE